MMTDVPALPHTVCITGAAHGLGACLARGFHSAGFRVAKTDVDGDAALELAQALDASGQTALGLSLDNRDASAFEPLIARIADIWGAIQVLVNNAAVTRAKPLLDITAEDFDEVMAVNLRGTFLASQAFARHFRDQSYGRLINIASLAGQNGGTATGAHYAASKGAVLTLTKIYARELAAHGVTANAISPGPLDLPSVRRIVPEEQLQMLVGNIPAGQLGDPSLIADIAVRLARPDAGYITGACWDANGGLFMR